MVPQMDLNMILVIFLAPVVDDQGSSFCSSAASDITQSVLGEGGGKAVSCP